MAKTPRRTVLDDKFTISSPNSTTVRLGIGSLVTVAGVQYKIQSNLDATASGLSANALYCMYVMIANGNPTLAISTNVNSVGPIGATAWKLVGAFHANGLGVFGAFVTIEGTPTSTDWNVASTFSCIGGAFSLGNGTTLTFAKRHGDIALFKVQLIFGSTTSYGGGSPRIDDPVNMTRAGALISDDPQYGNHGYAYDLSGANSVYAPVGMYDWGPNGLLFQLQKEGGSSAFLGPTFPFTWTAADKLAGIYALKIAGWSTIPLKDL